MVNPPGVPSTKNNTIVLAAHGRIMAAPPDKDAGADPEDRVPSADTRGIRLGAHCRSGGRCALNRPPPARDRMVTTLVDRPGRSEVWPSGSGALRIAKGPHLLASPALRVENCGNGMRT